MALAPVSADAPRYRPHAAVAAREYLIALAGGLVLYLVSVAPGALWQDSGTAQLRVLAHDLHGNLGLAAAHPLYYLIAIAFQVLPFHESAFKTNLVSPVFGALTVANVYLLLRLLTRRRTPAVIGAVSLALAHTFWQHCALAEVYTVSTALMTAELLCLYRYFVTRNAGWLVLLYFTNGVGVCNHNLALLSMACYGVLTLYLLATRRVSIPVFLGCIGLWLVGAALYLGMIISEIAGGAPVGATLQSATTGNFVRAVTNVVPTFKLLKNSALYLVLDFPTPTALLGLLGIVAVLRARRRSSRPFLFTLLALLAIHLLWAIRYDVQDQYTFFIPAIVMIGVFIGLGADRFLTARRMRWAPLIIVGALLPAVAYAVAPRVLPQIGFKLPVKRELPFRDEYTYFLQPWKTGYDGALHFAEKVRDLLPSPSIVVADITAARPLEYLRETGRWRDGIRIVRFQELAPDDPKVTPEYLAADLAAGRVYVITPQRGYVPKWMMERCTFEPCGIIWHVAGYTSE